MSGGGGGGAWDSRYYGQDEGTPALRCTVQARNDGAKRIWSGPFRGFRVEDKWGRGRSNLTWKQVVRMDIWPYVK